MAGGQKKRPWTNQHYLNNGRNCADNGTGYETDHGATQQCNIDWRWRGRAQGMAQSLRRALDFETVSLLRGLTSVSRGPVNNRSDGWELGAHGWLAPSNHQVVFVAGSQKMACQHVN